jgi:type VI protein secretion system component VasF
VVHGKAGSQAHDRPQTLVLPLQRFEKGGRQHARIPFGDHRGKISAAAPDLLSPMLQLEQWCQQELPDARRQRHAQFRWSGPGTNAKQQANEKDDRVAARSETFGREAHRT